MQGSKRLIWLAVACAAIAGLSACGGNNDPAPQVVQGADGNPVAIQQQKGPSFLEMAGAAVAGNVVGNMLTGGGRAAAPAAAPAYVHAPTINKTVVNKTVIVQAPTTSPKVAAPAPKVASTPSYRPSTNSYRPSYNSSRSISSFSGRRR